MQLTMPPVEKRRKLWRAVIPLALIAGIALFAFFHLRDAGIPLEEGELFFSRLRVSAPFDGTIAEVGVRSGQRVRAGDILFVYSRDSLEGALTSARAELSAIAAALPPEIKENLADSKPQTRVDLEQQLVIRQRQENDARKAMEAASTLEARANVDAALAQSRAGERETFDAAMEARSKARADLAAAREAFERASLERHATENKLRTLRELERRMSSANAGLQVRAYEGQLARVRALESRLGESGVKCPKDGVLTRVDIAPGAAVTAGQPVVELALPNENRFFVVAYGAAGQKIAVGAPCTVRLEGVPAVFEGAVADVMPLPAAPKDAPALQSSAAAPGGGNGAAAGSANGTKAKVVGGNGTKAVSGKETAHTSRVLVELKGPFSPELAGLPVPTRAEVTVMKKR